MGRRVSRVLERPEALISVSPLACDTSSLLPSFLCSLLHLWKLLLCFPLLCLPILFLCSLLLLFRRRACPLCRRRWPRPSFHHIPSRTNLRLCIEWRARESPALPFPPRAETFSLGGRRTVSIF